MWVLKSKFSMALIIAIILTLSLIAVWYVTPVPKVSPLILSDIENLDFIATMEGTFGKEGEAYLFCKILCGVWEVPILIESHVYTTNGTIRLQNATAIHLTNPICTQWRAISEPDVLLGKKYHLQNWTDKNNDGKLSSSDQININKTEPAPVGPLWCDVEDVEYGAIYYINITAGADKVCLQNATAIDLTNPACTQWRAISALAEKYHLLNWTDNNKDGKLSSSDQIDMNKTEPEPVGPRWWDVQDVEYAAIYYMTVTKNVGDNIILWFDTNIIRTDTNETIADLSGISTYVFNKLTRENVEDAPEASKNRTGFDPFYPSHIKLGENISNIWLDNIDETGTLRFVKTVKEEDVELYEYFLNKTLTKEWDFPGGFYDNYTLTNTKNVLIEPLSGLPVYTKNETVIVVGNWFNTAKNVTESTNLIYLTYRDKEMDLVTPRLAHGAMEVLEFDKVVKGWILGAIIVILTVAFIFNTGSLWRARKMPSKAKT